MENHTFETLLASMGYKAINGMTSVGVTKGYPIRVVLQPKNSSTNYQIIISTNKALSRSALRPLRTQSKVLGATMPGVVSQADCMTLTGSISAAREVSILEQVILAATTALESEGIKERENCPLCKQRECDVYALNGNGYVPVHRACVEKQVNEGIQSAEVNDQSGNYFGGIVGCLLGCLVGAIPSLLTIIFFEYILSIVFALIPLCGYYGYKLLRGKLNKSVIITTIVCSLIATLGLIIAANAWTVADELGTSIPEGFRLLFYAFSVKSGLFMEMLTDNVITFVFVGLGIWVVWGRITQTNTSIKMGNEAIQASLTSKGESASAAL